MLDAFHDDLDFVSVHEGIVQDLKAIVQSNRGKHSLDSQVEAIYSAKGQKLIERPAFSRVSSVDRLGELAFDIATQVFKDLVRQILQGKALSVEQLVELITLKDNSTTPDEYSTSLQLLERAAVRVSAILWTCTDSRRPYRMLARSLQSSLFGGGSTSRTS